ncbi:hypothetical protein M3N64_02500 [Sporolactobacillus sp. CPB3-1]|uniref:Uncharacterized protein n=1 Tax=Sporolactobacillus mangiferae TaxID=2940498 RepID=A0ABT0M7G8_9BACL|nr:hypothetical protein [Sporolactobacillus mangiferae]MCL1630812.1 hypothetical protein [Sporolactobacillus mangiferae]
MKNVWTKQVILSALTIICAFITVFFLFSIGGIFFPNAAAGALSTLGPVTRDGVEHIQTPIHFTHNLEKEMVLNLKAYLGKLWANGSQGC